MPPADGVSSSRQRRPTRRLRAEPCSRPALDTARGARRGGACGGGGRVAAAQMCHRRQLRRTGGRGWSHECACVRARVRAHGVCFCVCTHARACVSVRVGGCASVSLRAPRACTCVRVRPCARALAARVWERRSEVSQARLESTTWQTPLDAILGSSRRLPSAGLPPRARWGLFGGSELPVTVCAQRLGSREGGG